MRLKSFTKLVPHARTHARKPPSAMTIFVVWRGSELSAWLCTTCILVNDTTACVMCGGNISGAAGGLFFPFVTRVVDKEQGDAAATCSAGVCTSTFYHRTGWLLIIVVSLIWLLKHLISNDISAVVLSRLVWAPNLDVLNMSSNAPWWCCRNVASTADWGLFCRQCCSNHHRNIYFSSPTNSLGSHHNWVKRDRHNHSLQGCFNMKLLLFQSNMMILLLGGPFFLYM